MYLLERQGRSILAKSISSGREHYLSLRVERVELLYFQISPPAATTLIHVSFI